MDWIQGELRAIYIILEPIKKKEKKKYKELYSLVRKNVF